LSAILWWEQVNFQWNDDEVRFVLDQSCNFAFGTCMYFLLKMSTNEGLSLDIYRRRIGSFHSTPVRGKLQMSWYEVMIHLLAICGVQISPSWNITKVGVKHQSRNQSINQSIKDCLVCVFFLFIMCCCGKQSDISIGSYLYTRVQRN
jgi:hypothetical protein